MSGPGTDAAVKPLLIMPPAPARWPPLDDLLRHKGQPWLRDIERRLVHGVAEGVPSESQAGSGAPSRLRVGSAARVEAQDVYGVIPAGGQFLANACINKYGDVGVLGHCYTRPEHRRQGYARRLVDAVVSWFDMTGGRWLFLGTTAELDEGFYRKFGFLPLRRVSWAPYDRVTLWRPGRGLRGDPFADLAGDVAVRDVTRAEWPAMVAMLQYCPGADPRVPLDESAVNAEVFTLDLIDHQERGACVLKGAFRGPRLVGLATIATEHGGERTYGMLIPHVGAPPELRAAVAEFAQRKGYAQIDFPMEGLRGSAGGTPELAGAAPTAPAPPSGSAEASPAQPASPTLGPVSDVAGGEQVKEECRPEDVGHHADR
jgi:GNAT superfamily N-acetyltransferase